MAAHSCARVGSDAISKRMSSLMSLLTCRNVIHALGLARLKDIQRAQPESRPVSCSIRSRRFQFDPDAVRWVAKMKVTIVLDKALA